jgi:hypothetical protein
MAQRAWEHRIPSDPLANVTAMVRFASCRRR